MLACWLTAVVAHVVIFLSLINPNNRILGGLNIYTFYYLLLQVTLTVGPTICELCWYHYAKELWNQDKKENLFTTNEVPVVLDTENLEYVEMMEDVDEFENDTAE